MIIITGCSIEETSLLAQLAHRCPVSLKSNMLRGRERGVIGTDFWLIRLRKTRVGGNEVLLGWTLSGSHLAAMRPSCSPAKTPPTPACYLLNKHSRLLADGGHVCKTKLQQKKSVITIIIHTLRSRRFIYRCYADVDAALIRNENKGARHNSAERCQRASL